MILLIDDDPVYLRLTKGLLEDDGHEVAAFSDSVAALEFAARQPPDLVISDVVMPTMDGHALLRRYRTDFPERDTPFLFLSGVDEPAEIIQAMEEGATDYVPKPVDPGVLCAKVRRHLQPQRHPPRRVFCGNLADLRFQRLVRHCEESGLTGIVELDADDVHASIRFRAGRLDETSVTDDTIERLCDRHAGRFTIVSEAAVVEGLKDGDPSSHENPSDIVDSTATPPAGRLSGIQAGDRLVQLQTQVEKDKIVTVAVLGGKTLLRRQRATSDSERGRLEEAIAAQHRAAEEEVRGKLERLLAKAGAASGNGATERFAQLYRQGIEKYEDGNYAAACVLWEMAAAIDPTNRVLTVQVEAARKKAFAGTCLGEA